MRVLGTHDPHVSLTWHRSLSIAHAGARVWSDGPSGGLNTTTTAPVVCLLVHFCRGRGGLFVFVFRFLCGEGGGVRYQPPRVARGRVPIDGCWTVEGGRRKGYVCTRGTRMEGGTRMDTEGVHARPSRGRHRVAGYALGGGFRAGSNDC